MHDITRKNQAERFVAGHDEEGKKTSPDSIAIQRTLDGDPEEGNRAFDVARFDKSVLKDGDLRRDFERRNLVKQVNRSWVNQWARE